MREPISSLTQSRYYSPAFNAAIFDGPIRIYFAQHQEAAALKLYFKILERLKDVYGDLREGFRRNQQNIFVMLYPSSELFHMVFPSDEFSDISIDELEGDFIIGMNGLIDDLDASRFWSYLDGLVARLPHPAEVTA